MTDDHAWVWASQGLDFADVELLAQYNARPAAWKADKPFLAHQMAMLQVRFNLAVRAARLDEGWVPLHRADIWVRADGAPTPYGVLP